MTRPSLNELLNTKVQQWEALRKEIDQIAENLTILNEEQILADLLHSKFCHHNHLDGCTWDYETWDNIGSDKGKWLAKASNVMEAADGVHHRILVNIIRSM